jgi:hypothetical protein
MEVVQGKRYAIDIFIVYMYLCIDIYIVSGVG